MSLVVSDGDTIVGREEEQHRIGQLLGHARNNQGGGLVVIGEPGIGKTALLEHAIATATAMRVVALAGHDSESTLPFAAVQRLVIPLRDHLPALSERHRQALEVAGGAAGPAPDRFLVGLGLLALLAEAGASAPVLCVVDDAHLLDQESLEALAFVARRIEVEPIAMLLAARDEREVTTRLSGVRELPLSGLASEPAMHLLSRSVPEPIDPVAAALIARATGGNPLALIDLAQDLSSRRLGDLALADEPVPVGHRLEAHYVSRVRRADPAVQEWVLLAAADSTGEVELVRSAARLLGIDDEVGDRAELAGLVELADSVRFRHPLVRSAVYNAASGADRRRVHRALAEAAGSLGLVELEAWHAAKATVGTDPAVADRLEHAADLAAARGGFASRAAVLGRAAELTPDGPARDARLVAAAEAALAVGAAQTARAHLEATGEATDPGVRGRMIVVEHGLALFTVDATRMPVAAARLAEAADLFHGVDPEREQLALMRAFEAYCVTDRMATGITREELGARLAAGAEVADGVYGTILRGLGALMLAPYAEAVPAARAAFDAAGAVPPHQLMTMGSVIGSLGMFLWDDGGRRELLDRAAHSAREAGALQDLDTLLWVISLAELWGGTVREAEDSIEQVREVRRAMGYDAENVINAALMAWTGLPKELVHAIGEGADAVGFGGVAASGFAALATRELAESEYQSAYERLRPMVERSFLHVGPSYFADFVEAAVRSERPDVATDYVARLEELVDGNGSAWCGGVALRSRALVSPPAEAEVYYKGAVDQLEDTVARVDLARAHLLYGEWLRRERRRGDAAQHLRVARDLFVQTGAQIFVPRTQAELDATGVDVGPHADVSHDLTHQELSIARLAASGRTNAEIGSALFISPNTVDYHLRKVFQKLGISSRRQLADRLPT